MTEVRKPGVPKVTRRAAAPPAARTGGISGPVAVAGAGQKAAATQAAHQSETAPRGTAPEDLGALEEKTELQKPGVRKQTRRAGASNAARTGGVSGAGVAAVAGAGRKAAATRAAHGSETGGMGTASEDFGALEDFRGADRRVEGVPITGFGDGRVRRPETAVELADPDGRGSLGGERPAVPVQVDEVLVSRMRKVALYGGIVVLGLLEVVEWPVVVALGAGAYLYRRVGVDRRAAGRAQGVAEPGNAAESSR